MHGAARNVAVMNRSVWLLLLAGCAGSPPPFTFTPASPPVTAVHACWIDTGGVDVPARYGTAGSTGLETWKVTSAVLLVRHPEGDVLVDTGISPAARDEVAGLSAWRRFVFSQTAGRNVARRSLPEALRALGVTRVRAVILSHAHPDHAGGVAALAPDVPVLVAPDEKAFIEREAQSHRGVVVPAQADALLARLSPITFTDGGFEGFDAHFDLFGDGSVVVVPTPGHTPGSVATFVTLDPQTRLLHVGDLVNLQDSLARGTGKSWLMRQLTDEDVAATDAQVQKLVALQQADPSLVVLPAHDAPAWEAVFGRDDGGPLPPCR